LEQKEELNRKVRLDLVDLGYGNECNDVS
jgi:hypothetical protein